MSFSLMSIMSQEGFPSPCQPAPGPSRPVVPKYRYRCVCYLSVIEGLIALFYIIVLAIRQDQHKDIDGHTLFAGLLFFMVGVFGCISSKNRTLCTIVALFVIAVFGITATLISICIWFTRDTSELLEMNIAVPLVAGGLLILTTILSSLACHGILTGEAKSTDEESCQGVLGQPVEAVRRVSGTVVGDPVLQFPNGISSIQVPPAYNTLSPRLPEYTEYDTPPPEYKEKALLQQGLTVSEV